MVPNYSLLIAAVDKQFSHSFHKTNLFYVLLCQKGKQTTLLHLIFDSITYVTMTVTKQHVYFEIPQSKQRKIVKITLLIETTGA